MSKQWTRTKPWKMVCRFESPRATILMNFVSRIEFDLSMATQKTLVRLRRDDLVRLCEARDLVVDGTKPQLAQALLEWRDSQEDDIASTSSAPSSTSTARPLSTMRHNVRANGSGRRKGSKGKSLTPPVLLRSHFHDDEPITPPVSKGKKEEGDLELDLELLGLEDREIPAEKLTKLEKIGSGGFKDVFVGKFKGRRVAIAELRDQLSPSEFFVMFNAYFFLITS